VPDETRDIDFGMTGIIGTGVVCFGKALLGVGALEIVGILDVCVVDAGVVGVVDTASSDGA
jgi:hypothetical protein